MEGEFTMKRKNVQVIVSRFLLLALLSGPFLMMAPINEADAWLMHQTNCRTTTSGSADAEVNTSTDGVTGKVGIKGSIKLECDTEWHWNPLPHGDGSSSSSGSCDSDDEDWCDFCEEEHWVCNHGTGW